jgi:hypothetical protein
MRAFWKNQKVRTVELQKIESFRGSIAKIEALNVELNITPNFWNGLKCNFPLF